MRKKRRSSRDHMMRRQFAVASIHTSIRSGIVARKGEEPRVDSRPWLKVRATLEEPIGAAQEITIVVFYADEPVVGPTDPAGVGFIHSVKPVVDACVTIDTRTFDLLWGLALSGRLTHGSLHFTKPRYGQARVTDVSFGNEREE